MDHISRWMPYNNDERIAHNVETISKFPSKNSAQIKANNLGTLEIPKGKKGWAVSFVATQVGLATELDGTVAAIEETFKAVAEQVANDISRLHEKITPTTIEKLKEDVATELGLMKGLQNIQTVLSKALSTFLFQGRCFNRPRSNCNKVSGYN